MDYFSNWKKLFLEVSKHLKEKGYFIFSIGNPVTECIQKIRIKKKVYRVLTDYFTERKLYTTWWKGDRREIKMPAYHKTYETIIKIILENGFELVDYKDAFPDMSSKRLFPKDYDIFSKIPYFCAWKVKKKFYNLN